MIFTFVSAALLLASATAAAPQSAARNGGCPVANDVLALPAGAAISVPADAKPNFVLLGTGVQNYTCSTGAYVSAGAVAKLFDISCLFGTPEFDAIASQVQDAGDYEKAEKVLARALRGRPTPVGDHYFITNPITGTGISPRFDLTTPSTPNAFITGKKLGGIPAPEKKDVDWLQLGQIQGDLAKFVFRVQTRGGQPPASCTDGSPLISVRYTAQYWLYA